MDIDDDIPPSFASPPCLMHELDPAYAGLSSDRSICADVRRWRTSERARLIAQRLTISPDLRTACKRRSSAVCLPKSDRARPVCQRLLAVSGEPDLRPLMRQ